MASANEKGVYKIQLSISEEEYQILRKKAYEMDKTINKAILLLALEAAMK